MKRVVVTVVGLASAFALAACSSDSSSSPSSSVGTPSGSPTSSSAVSTAASTTASSQPTKSGLPASSSTATPGPATAGARIKGGAASTLPATIGEYRKLPPSGPATLYENADGDQIAVGFLLGSNYDTIVTAVTRSKTPAGTGLCGTDSSPTNATCYLAAEDGVYNVSGDTVPGVALFSNQLTAALGTA